MLATIVLSSVSVPVSAFILFLRSINCPNNLRKNSSFTSCGTTMVFSLEYVSHSLSQDRSSCSLALPVMMSCNTLSCPILPHHLR
ncbi:Os04g0162975 [Oryza sativa Japonica Group]|uniref:Os04g0162975 protein n=1 Tax=Oryza sativa subsp. japonica TaxID=39947 RepID=A0A0P0W7E4_ORYSJ|nr:hypothetical protein EE612_022138 [Oryza sativa]BAS87855.1 Os04g0162975 [Oryza sativa Japonica Group]